MDTNLKHIEIFKAGQHQSMNGEMLIFTVSDLAVIAEAYDSEIFEAPIVVGHPKLNSPAYGWVKSLCVKDDRLIAKVEQLDEDFLQLIREGKYKKISASFYDVSAINNPKPGYYYLRHVGFLGAQAPAVKGLKEVYFSDTHQETIDFEYDYSDHKKVEKLIEQFFVRLVDFFKSKYSHGLKKSVNQEDEKFFQLNDQPYDSNKENIFHDLIEENKLLKQELKILSNELENIQEAKQKNEIEVFVEKLISSGQIMPRDKVSAIKVLELVSSEDSSNGKLEFSENKTGRFSSCIFEAVSNLPKQLQFSEIATLDQVNNLSSSGIDNELDDFYNKTVDTSRLEIHERITQLAKEHNIPYDSAAKLIINKE